MNQQVRVLLALVVSVALSAAEGWTDERVRQLRVEFQPGTSSATVEGTITGYEVVDYLVGARAGQTMAVALTTGHSATYFNVLPPDSEDEAVFVGSTSGGDFEGRLDLDGDWKIRVYMMRSAARRGEAADFRLELSVHGEPDPSFAREANDFGPREWDARGDLGCAQGGAPMQPAACPFKVVRSAAGGTVFAVKPGGEGIRILYLESGEWSTDSAAVVAVGKRSDLWTLTVEGETYEVPEAVLDGG